MRFKVVFAVILVAILAPSTSTAAVGTNTQTGMAPGYMILTFDDATLDLVFADLNALKVKSLRIDIDWSLIEATRGVRNWSITDRITAKAATAGIEILGVISYTPAWARAGGTNNRYPPTNPTNYAKFAAAVSARYRTMQLEIWNEPNQNWAWQPQANAAAYRNLLVKTYAAIKAVNPSAYVLSGGVVPTAAGVNPFYFLQDLYRLGARNSFDAVAVHPYSFPLWPADPASNFTGVRYVRDLMVANGDSAKKIVGTEMGVPTGTGSSAVSEQTQAEMLTEAFTYWKSLPYTGSLYWYSHIDACADLSIGECNFGIRRNTTAEAKPAWAALQAVG